MYNAYKIYKYAINYFKLLFIAVQNVYNLYTYIYISHILICYVDDF